MSLKNNVKWVQALLAAGFDLTNSMSTPTRNGIAWSATLVYGRTKLAVISNGGNGGADRLDICEDKKLPRTALLDMLNNFRKVPAVLEYAQQLAMESIESRAKWGHITEHDVAVEKEKILSTELAIDDDTICSVVTRFVDLLDSVKMLKRVCAKKICWMPKDVDGADEYYATNAPDTPDNRARVQDANKAKFGYFIADLLDGKI